MFRWDFILQTNRYRHKDNVLLFFKKPWRYDEIILIVLFNRVKLSNYNVNKTSRVTWWFITVTSLVKFDEIRFARYKFVLMEEFLLYLLGMFDVHGIGNFVFFLCTRVSIVPLICKISVSKIFLGWFQWLILF